MKKLITLLLCALSLIALGCGGGDKQAGQSADGQKQVLNLFSWADNFSPKVLEDFEKKYNCKINYDVFANNEELLAKIQAGGSRYDVIQPSDYMVATMIKLNLLEELDQNALGNTRNILPALQKPAYDPQGKYSVVYTCGVTGIVYKNKYIK